MKYVLIMVITFTGHAISITSHDFDSKSSCEIAKSNFLNMDTGWLTSKNAICTEK